MIEGVTTKTFSQPAFKDGGLTFYDRSVRRFGCGRCCGRSTSRPTWVPHLRDVGRREGSEYDGSKDVYAAIERDKEGLAPSRLHQVEGYDLNRTGA